MNPMPTYRWVRRNEDKPHRCPRCHAVVTWLHDRYGPRTVLRCWSCVVKWRAGLGYRSGSVRGGVDEAAHARTGD